MATPTKILVLSTYPPKECGIATFSCDLIEGLKVLAGNHTFQIEVAALNESDIEKYEYTKIVKYQLNRHRYQDYTRLAKTVNQDSDIRCVLIQHEYGIFGGDAGQHLLYFLKNCRKPIITTFHTAIPDPTPAMQRVTQQLLTSSAYIVVMAKQSRKLLLKLYHPAPGKIRYIPHGVHPIVYQESSQIKPGIGLAGRTVLSTFGFLSRSKGIEYAIQALPQLTKRYPKLLYLVLGQTHPNVRRLEGESYRLELMDLVRQLKLTRHIRFYDKYLPLPVILTYLQATDIYLSTSLNPYQSVSGTFSYALATGRPVIATEFTQAKEALQNHTGLTVPMRNPDAFAQAIQQLLSQPQRLKKSGFQAYQQTRTMLWTNVAYQYLQLVGRILTPRSSQRWFLPKLSLKHLENMTDNFGMLQFANGDKPEPGFGYTLDDNARALIAAQEILLHSPTYRKKLLPLLKIYSQFIVFCQKFESGFVNYVSTDQQSPTTQNQSEDLEDTLGRTIWATSIALTSEFLSPEHHRQLQIILDKSLPSINRLTHLRPMAYTLLGLTLLTQHQSTQNFLPTIKILTTRLLRHYRRHANDQWQWFEPKLTYGNGWLSLALFQVGYQLQDPVFLEIAQTTLNFLIQTTFYGDVYVPIGQQGWYVRGRHRPLFDQQPEDATSMTICLCQAYHITKNPLYRQLAHKCFSWFLGNNLLGKPLYNPQTGGCFDGLAPHGVNLNQGAESLVSYLQARIAIEKL